MRIKKTYIVIRRILLLVLVYPAQVLCNDDPIPFAIAPYLTDLGTETVTVNWRLKRKSDSFIRYGITLNHELNEVTSESSVFQHSISLSGLTPDTLYHYNVNNIHKGSFRTDRLTNKTRFVAFGHSHGTERFNHYPDRLLLSKIRDLAPDFLVHMGDSTFYSNVDDFKEYFFDEISNLIESTPIFMSPGNHDAGWPFVYGPDLTTFKNLFPYPYPEEIKENKKEAFYSITKGNIQFLFVSYTSPLEPGSLQREWLARKLTASQYDFNVVVYGGAQAAYFDKSSLLDFLANYDVDLILNGDGSNYYNKFLKTYKGMPVYFIGTNGNSPHDLLYVEHEGDHLSLKRISATGQLVSTEWIYIDKKYNPKYPIINKPRIKDKLAITTTEFTEYLSSKDINGVQILFNKNKGSRAIIYAYITPSDSMNVPNNEGGFRTQYHEYSGESDTLITLSFPKENPLKGGEYKIIKLSIYILAVGSEVEDIEIHEMYLY